ncbi:MAG: hypothetical protein KatS3mg082_3165 [Nitrospiraceae bacterium]|nr:MAG: hypothetical protein KatS3mg082_3165 [Nitrospiraceae bacterium]
MLTPLNIGRQVVNGEITETGVGLTAHDRVTHLYLTGASRSGKSRLLEGLLRQHILTWRTARSGLLLIDPHGELASGLVSWMTRYAYDTAPIVIADLSDPDRVVGLSPLTTGPREGPDAAAAQFVKALGYIWNESDSAGSAVRRVGLQCRLRPSGQRLDARRSRAFDLARVAPDPPRDSGPHRERLRFLAGARPRAKCFIVGSNPAPPPPPPSTGRTKARGRAATPPDAVQWRVDPLDADRTGRLVDSIAQPERLGGLRSNVNSPTGRGVPTLPGAGPRPSKRYPCQPANPAGSDSVGSHRRPTAWNKTS